MNIKASIMLSCVLFLASCSYLAAPPIDRHRDQDYLQAKHVPLLVLPTQMKKIRFEPYYPLPERTEPGKAKPIVVLNPPGLIDN